MRFNAVATTWCLAIVAGITWQSCSSACDPPNVLLIIVDDLRACLNDEFRQPSGLSRPITPAMDQLESRSISFKRAYTAVPVCGGSRAAMLTGMAPTASRFRTYNARAEVDAPEAITLPGLFKQNGYQTRGYGKVFHNVDDSEDDWTRPMFKPNAPLTRWRQYATAEGIRLSEQPGGKGLPYEMGTDDRGESLPDTAYYDGQTAREVALDLRSFAEAKRGGNAKNFFFAVGFVKPHLPFVSPKRYWDRYSRDNLTTVQDTSRGEGIPLQAFHTSQELRAFSRVPDQIPFDENYRKLLTHAYLASVSYVDAQIGRVLAELDRLGLRNSTAVILVSDHGYFLGDHAMWTKHALFEEALRVPLFVSCPGQKEGRVRDDPVSTLDIFPTLVSLCNLESPNLQPLAGVDLLDPNQQRTSRMVASRYEDGISASDGRYRWSGYPAQSTGNEWEEVLFDLKADPTSKRNRLHDATGADKSIAKRLQQAAQ